MSTEGTTNLAGMGEWGHFASFHYKVWSRQGAALKAQVFDS